MANPEILIDMDGVLAAFDRAVEDGMKDSIARGGLRFVRPRKNFYIHEDYPESMHEDIKAIWQAKGFYRRLPLMEGAVEGWQRIMEAGYAPRICSSPIPQNPDCITEKRAWLEEHFVPQFGYKILDSAIFDRDKSKYDAIALIDDKPSVVCSQLPSWTHIIFDAPYNQQTYASRLYGWYDPNLESTLYSVMKANLEG